MIHIALLRAVNLGAYNKVGMADLRDMLSDLGFGNPKSLLQSGNLVFEADGKTTTQLETELENAARKHLGLATSFFVRTAAEWQGVVSGNPFPDAAKNDPTHLVVMVLKAAPGARAVADLRKAITGRETVRTKGRHAYVVYPDGIGRSRFTNALMEKKLGTTGTGRNWNTVLKLAALVDA